MERLVSLSEMLDSIRRSGWRVAVHNDYEVNGELFTFWLFTNPRSGRFFKAEARTDLEAVNAMLEQLGLTEVT